MAPKSKKPAAEDAVVRLQAAMRGFLARRSVRAVLEVEREVEAARARIACDVELLCGDDARPRAAAAEALMRLLLRLDAVRGARDYRRRVIRRVLALQDAVDAFDPARAPVAVGTEAGTDEESPAAPEVSSFVEAESKAAVDAPTDMEVDEAVRDCEDEAGSATGDASADVKTTDVSDTESEWEMVEEEECAAPATASSHDHDAPLLEPAGKDTAAAGTNAGVCDGVDSRQLIEMVAALCERNAQQSAVITVLAERVDALERAVRLMEDAEPRRQRAKKISKEGKGINDSKFASD